MPSFVGKTFNSYFKNLLGIDQSTNTGIDATTRAIQDGLGQDTALSLSSRGVRVDPDADTTTTFAVRDSAGNSIMTVDTSANVVRSGLSQLPPTLFKDMGLFDFSPTIGYHNPLISNNMMLSDSGADIIEDISMFGNGTDPEDELDLSADGTPMIAIACYWYLENDIILDSIRYMTTAAGTSVHNFHLFAYDLDNSTNHGDLSEGTLHAHVHSADSTGATVRTGTMSIDSSVIYAGKVVVGFVESDATHNISCTLNIKYHIQ